MKYRLGDFTTKHWNDWDHVPRMPQAIGNYILGTALGSTVLFGSVTLGYVVGYIAITAVTSWALRALAPKPDFGSSRGLLVNSREATAPQEIVYGEIRKGGTVTFIESTGDTNQYLHQVIVLAGHEVNDIGDIYINENQYEVNGSGWVTDQRYDEETEAYVTDNKWGYNSGTSTSKIRIKKHTGADNQTADSDLVSETSVTSDFKGEGIAYIYVRMEYDQDVFAEGVPLFTAKVQGKKVYDPRTSSTGYSANAALCIRDYLVSAYGLDNSGDVNDAYFQTAANTCDESVTLAGSGTESRYEINGIISLDRSPSDILGDMMTACAGTLFWGQGEWHLKVGEYTSSIKTFTLDDLRGPINLETKHSRRDNFNIVRGTFNDADQGFIRADYPEIRSSTFITNDGGVENALDLALPLTTSAATAQRLAKMTLFRAREEMTFTADFGLEAFEVECGDIIALTIDRYGWTAKEFEVVGWKFRNDGDAGDLRVALTLRETSAAAFSWSAEESQITANNSTLPSPSDSITPSSIAVTDTGVVQTDGTFVAQVKVAWTAGTNKFIDHHEVQWKLTSASDYASAQIEAGQNSIILGPFEAGEQYNIRVRAVMTTGRKSTWVAASPHTVGGDTIAPSPVTGLSATGGVKSVTLDWTAPTTQAGGGDLYDLKGYHVYRSTSNSQPSNHIAFVSADRFVDGGLAENTTYYYWVEAIDFTTPPNTSTVVASDPVTTDAALTAGQDGADGADGDDGDTVVTGRVYYQILQAGTPSAPSATGFNFSTGLLTGLSANYSQTQPAVDITDTSVYEWSASFTATKNGSTGLVTVSFGSLSNAIQVTTDLESDNYVAGSAGWKIERDTGNAEFQNAIIRGTLNANDIRTGTLTVNELPGLTFADVVTGGNTSSFDANSTADSTAAIRSALGFGAQTMYRYNNYASLSGIVAGSTLIGTATLTIKKISGSDPSGMNTCYFVLYDGSTVVTSPCTNVGAAGNVTLENNGYTATFTAALAIESAASGTATMGFYFSGGSSSEDEMSADRYSLSVIEFTK